MRPAFLFAIIAVVAALSVFCLESALAAPAEATDQELTKCLNRAEQWPDQAAAETDVWLKQGGGDRARLCHAFAQFHRGEFNAAADEFALLGAKFEKSGRKKAASIHTQAGLAAMRGGDMKKAEAEYAAALRLEPHDPDVWVDRASLLAGSERYWEALNDLNRALDIMPDMPEALRLRAQIRVKLGQDRGAKSDFEYARAIDGAENEDRLDSADAAKR